MGERYVRNVQVVGSNPIISTITRQQLIHTESALPLNGGISAMGREMLGRFRKHTCFFRIYIVLELGAFTEKFSPKRKGSV